jgi:hypothetical protein
MAEVITLAFTAALNPTLLAAATVMLLLPRPQRLLIGYWLGAMLTSITVGLVIVFTLQGSSVVSTTKRTVSPTVDLVVAGLLLIIVVVLATGRDQRLEERRSKRRGPKKPPRWQQTLSRGTAKTTFVVGMLLSFPGASYLAGLTHLSRLHYSTAATVLVVIGFNLIQLILLEAPLIAYAIAPEQTPAGIDRAKAWAGSHWRRYAIRGLGLIAVLLIVRGIAALV